MKVVLNWKFQNNIEKLKIILNIKNHTNSANYILINS